MPAPFVPRDADGRSWTYLAAVSLIAATGLRGTWNTGMKKAGAFLAERIRPSCRKTGQAVLADNTFTWIRRRRP
jgi:hypothetical protein